MRTHVSPPSSPADRGEEFGSVNADAIAATLARYRELFARLAGEPVDLRAVGDEALEVIADYAPDAAAEIRGLAVGAGLEPWAPAALNARTEILARLGAALPAECSTVVLLLPGGEPLTMQTWDWHDLFADGWLAWTIEHPDGRVVHTVTEYGLLGKIGVNSRGVGVHLNILSHRGDGGRMGVPVHVLARTVLDRARHAAQAVALIGAARTSASSALSVVGASAAGATATCAELATDGLRFVLPSRSGVLLHTNHFLDPHLAGGDLAPSRGPDSYLRLDVLRRSLQARAPRDREELRALLADHSGGAGSVCCHPDDDAGLGARWATLATVSLDVGAGVLWVAPGSPCAGSKWLVCGSPTGRSAAVT